MFPFPSGRAAEGVAFAIVQVSQAEGRLSGGTVITVTATGITGTPTSTLGVVSNVLGGSFDITTTGSALAGAVAWTATNGDRQVSGSQRYIYLPTPVFLSIDPPSGPAGSTNAGRTFGISGTPPAGSTCPVTITVGAGTVSNRSVVAVAEQTGDISPPGAGLLSCVVTIDGVLSAAAFLYTGT